MSTYFDTLPKELRLELQGYRNNMLTQFINEQFQNHGIHFGADDEVEGTTIMNHYKNVIIPQELTSQVFIRKVSDAHHFKGCIEISSSQVMTFNILIQIYNNIYNNGIYPESDMIYFIKSINNRLKNDGWSERLLLYPNDYKSQHVIVINKNDIK